MGLNSFAGRRGWRGPLSSAGGYSSEVLAAHTASQKVAGNPDPSNYKILKAEEHENFLALMMVYPDCNNYEGKKILVFKDTTLLNVINQRLIDPHFFEDKDKKFISPIARFVPTDEGWGMAIAFIYQMCKNEQKKS